MSLSRISADFDNINHGTTVQPDRFQQLPDGPACIGSIDFIDHSTSVRQKPTAFAKNSLTLISTVTVSCPAAKYYSKIQ